MLKSFTVFVCVWVRKVLTVSRNIFLNKLIFFHRDHWALPSSAASGNGKSLAVSHFLPYLLFLCLWYDTQCKHFTKCINARWIELMYTLSTSVCIFLKSETFYKCQYWGFMLMLRKFWYLKQHLSVKEENEILREFMEEKWKLLFFLCWAFCLYGNDGLRCWVY